MDAWLRVTCWIERVLEITWLHFCIPEMKTVSCPPSLGSQKQTRDEDDEEVGMTISTKTTLEIHLEIVSAWMTCSSSQIKTRMGLIRSRSLEQVNNQA